MIRTLKSFVYYPAHFVGVFLLMLGYVASWICFLGMFVIGGFMLAGELDERWGVVAGLGVAGVVIRLLMEFYIRMLGVLNAGWDRPK